MAANSTIWPMKRGRRPGEYGAFFFLETSFHLKICVEKGWIYSNWCEILDVILYLHAHGYLKRKWQLTRSFKWKKWRFTPTLSWNVRFLLLDLQDSKCFERVELFEIQGWKCLRSNAWSSSEKTWHLRDRGAGSGGGGRWTWSTGRDTALKVT